MAKRRTATPVTLSPRQRERLERLWFYYGNHGPETTPGNHQFIQGLLEHGLDMRPSFNSRTRKSERPTSECERAVGAVLEGGGVGAGEAGVGLRLVPSPEEWRKPTSPTDPEFKVLLDDMKRRYRVQRERLEGEPESPDAA